MTTKPRDRSRKTQQAITRDRRAILIAFLESRPESTVAEIAEATGYRETCVGRVMRQTNAWLLENRDKRRIKVEVRGAKQFWRMGERGWGV
jgi:Mg/Co/Ni transporter MgtE